MSHFLIYILLTQYYNVIFCFYNLLTIILPSILNLNLKIIFYFVWNVKLYNFLDWLKKCKVGINGIKQAPIWKINEQDKQGLTNVKWLGRNQILNVTSNLTYFLDGAHTIESIHLCRNWYMDLHSESQL